METSQPNQKIDTVTLAKYVMLRYGDICGQNGIQHLKLQKLIYYIQAWHLTMFEEPLFEEDFQAWLHGPVLKSVWDEFKDFDMPLSGIKMDRLSPQDAEHLRNIVETALAKDQVQLIDDVLSEYGSMSGYDLELLTHSEDPWKNARKGIPPMSSSTNKISRHDMMTYYREQFSQNGGE